MEEKVLLGACSMINVIDFYNKMTGFVDEGGVVGVIYLSFIKVPHTVSHNILLPKLGSYGLDGWTSIPVKS